MGELSAVNPGRSWSWLDACTFPMRWVAGWRLWRQSKPVLVLVLTVDLAAAGGVFATGWMAPVGRNDWLLTGLLVALGLVHLEFSRGIERLRARDVGTGPYRDLKAVWNVAALLLLPPVLACVVIMATHTYGFLRIFRRDDRDAHHWVYSCATVLLASQAAAYLLATGVTAFPGLPGPHEIGQWCVVLAAVSVRWLVNYLLIIFIGGLSNPQMSFGDAFSRIDQQVYEAAAAFLAIVAAVLLERDYHVLLVGLFVITGVLQQTSRYHQWKREKPYDPVTGLYLRSSFVDQAQRIMDRAKFRGSTVGLLFLDIDRFKNINDTHGHEVGDKALVTLAKAIRHEIRGDKDIAGRWGGEEFVVVLPDVGRDSLAEVAERIRLRVRNTPFVYAREDPATDEVTITEVSMTASIGAALYPDQNRDEDLHEVILRADMLMYAAKNSGRDRVRISP